MFKGAEVLDINTIKDEIIEALLPLNPSKIILFGSHAYGTPTEDSDIDIFLLKDNLKLDELREYELQARKYIRKIIFEYHVGFDIVSAPTALINEREDYFYKVDVLQNGKVWYEQEAS